MEKWITQSEYCKEHKMMLQHLTYYINTNKIPVKKIYGKTLVKADFPIKINYHKK